MQHQALSLRCSTGLCRYAAAPGPDATLQHQALTLRCSTRLCRYAASPGSAATLQHQALRYAETPGSALRRSTRSCATLQRQALPIRCSARLCRYAAAPGSAATLQHRVLPLRCSTRLFCYAPARGSVATLQHQALLLRCSTRLCRYAAAPASTIKNPHSLNQCACVLFTQERRPGEFGSKTAKKEKQSDTHFLGRRKKQNFSKISFFCEILKNGKWWPRSWTGGWHGF